MSRALFSVQIGSFGILGSFTTLAIGASNRGMSHSFGPFLRGIPRIVLRQCRPRKAIQDVIRFSTEAPVDPRREEDPRGGRSTPQDISATAVGQGRSSPGQRPTSPAP